MLFVSLLLADLTASYNSGSIVDMTVELMLDFKNSRICEDSPVDAHSVYSGEKAIFVLRRNGDIEALKDGFAHRYALDYQCH